MHVPKELSVHGARAAFGPGSKSATEGQVVLELAHYLSSITFSRKGWVGMGGRWGHCQQ